MKKLLLTSVSIGALAITSPAAMAQEGVRLKLGGYYNAYIGYADQQETLSGPEVNNLGYLQDSEIHFDGQTTLDNGLTAGVHFEINSDRNDGDIEESYAFLEGDWGYVSAGARDGAPYILQVAAPSADSNYDGLRQQISPFNYNAGVVPSSLAGKTSFDYDQAPTGYSEKITYLTPVISGFQAGFSYAPDVEPSNTNTAFGFPQTNDNTQGAGYEAALRYEGEVGDVGVALGGGYSFIKMEDNASTAAGVDDRNVWNVGIDLNYGAFGLGAVYLSDDQGNLGNDRDMQTIAVGADYTYDRIKFGASWLNQQEDISATKDLETDRFTGGATYDYGSGLTFRGSLSYLYHDVPQGQKNIDGISLLLGTKIDF